MIKFEKPVRFNDCSLYFVGRCTDTSVLPEIQNTYKLFSFVKGNCVIHTFNNKYSVRSGDSFVVVPYEIFGINSIGDTPIEFDCLYFTADSGKFNDLLGSVKLSEIEGTRVIRDKNICKAVACVVEELEGNDVFSDELSSLVCSQILLYIMRNFDVHGVDIHPVDDSGIKLCASIVNYIDNRVLVIKNLSEVADALGYNYSYISNLFRKTLGITLNKYFITKKMNEAEKLLTETRTSVSEIAARLNYSSVYAFSKAFKDFYGESPVSVRKKNR